MEKASQIAAQWKNMTDEEKQVNTNLLFDTCHTVKAWHVSKSLPKGKFVYVTLNFSRSYKKQRWNKSDTTVK
jgi:hypothetical protein